MQTISFFQKDLKAVSYAMAKNDIRYYLNGVLVESNGQEIRLVATDGHRLHAVVAECPVASEWLSFIMPADMVKKCITTKGPRGTVNPAIHVQYDAGKISAKLPDGSEIVQFAVDGKFPDYTRVIPLADAEPALSVFNPEYVADAVAGYKDFMELKGKTPPSIGIRPHGASAGVLSANGFTAIVMSMRGEISGPADVRLRSPLQAPQSSKLAA